MAWKVNIDLTDETAKRIVAHIKRNVPFERAERIKDPVSALNEFIQHLDEREERTEVTAEIDSMSTVDLKTLMKAGKKPIQ